MAPENALPPSPPHNLGPTSQTQEALEPSSTTRVLHPISTIIGLAHRNNDQHFVLQRANLHPQSLQEKPLPRRIQRVSRLRPVFTYASSLRRVIIGLAILPLLRLNNSNCKLWSTGAGDCTPSDNLPGVLLNERGVASGWCQLASAIPPLRSTAKTRCVSIARSMIAGLKGRLLQSMSSIMSIRLIIAVY